MGLWDTYLGTLPALDGAIRAREQTPTPETIQACYLAQQASHQAYTGTKQAWALEREYHLAWADTNLGKAVQG